MCDSILRQNMLCAAARLTAGFLLVSAGLCSAQTAVNPRALLEEIAASKRDARPWHAEGIETDELTGEGMNLRTEIAFQAFFRDSSHMRWETNGDNRTSAVCDGADHWTYAEPGTGFYREPVEVSPCRSQLPAFDTLVDNLVSAAVVGVDHVPFEGAPRDCEIVRAEYRIPSSRGAGVAAGTTIIRTACVDPARKLILRDRTESWATGSNTRFTRTIAFHSYESGVPIPETALRFDVPTGTFLDPGPQIEEGDSAVPVGTVRLGSGVSRPELIQKVEPSSTEDARQAGVSGLILVSLTVDSDGNPGNPVVTRGLGYGLDEKAIEAVRQWRFHPGLKDGVPVAVGNLTVAVSFRPQ
jgi:TonB family protein